MNRQKGRNEQKDLSILAFFMYFHCKDVIL